VLLWKIWGTCWETSECDENTFRIYGNNKNSKDPTLPTIPKGKQKWPLGA
jgi:hypothetical protein